MNRIYFIFLGILVLLVIGCQKSNELVHSKITNQQIFHTDHYDDFNFPIIDSLGEVKILINNQFHENEIEEQIDREEWYGLFKNESSFYISKTKINLKRVRDWLVDNENEESGWEVGVNNQDSLLLLIQGIHDLPERNIEEIKLPEQLYPEEFYSFDYQGIEYRLYAEGDKNSLNSSEISNYRLYLSAKINDQEITSLLVARPCLDDQMVSIIFGGDLDNDGILDLIIDTTWKYNISIPTLYLSKPSEENEVVKPIAELFLTGC